MYATCKDCDLQLVDRNAADEHLSSTRRPDASDSPYFAVSHTITVHEVTLEQKQARRVQAIVEDVLDDAADRLHELVVDGELTQEQVRKALLDYPDFGDRYHDLLQEGGRG